MWQSVMKVVSNGGRCWEGLSDEEVLLVADCGGMKRIQNASDVSLNFIFNDFAKAYEKQINNFSFPSPFHKFNALGIDPESVAYLGIRNEKSDLTMAVASVNIPELEGRKEI